MDPPPIRARLQQPQWMTKAQVAQINTDLPDEDILTTIEHVKEAAVEQAAQANSVSSEAQSLFDPQAPLVRAWFYFPSISTRAKRDDLVNFAPTYGLTGFLMAGKPGILCLEGGSTAIGDFMKFIKTDSWGDIPSQHKKVSERYRQTEKNLVRAFNGMEEITETVGERRGERANRSDMKALETWLVDRGLGDAFNRESVSRWLDLSAQRAMTDVKLKTREASSPFPNNLLLSLLPSAFDGLSSFLTLIRHFMPLADLCSNADCCSLLKTHCCRQQIPMTALGLTVVIVGTDW
ncbi:hypothetical protein KC352_g55 [Hortaea werneckii]|nr:hypothetical protein KC352_g55 [Hortaea werneckii]